VIKDHFATPTIRGVYLDHLEIEFVAARCNGGALPAPALAQYHDTLASCCLSFSRPRLPPRAPLALNLEIILVGVELGQILLLLLL
jgi:hypothetical protein